MAAMKMVVATMLITMMVRMIGGAYNGYGYGEKRYLARHTTSTAAAVSKAPHSSCAVHVVALAVVQFPKMRHVIG